MDTFLCWKTFPADAELISLDCIIDNSPALGSRVEILQQQGLRLGLRVGLGYWWKDQILHLPLSHVDVVVVVSFLLDELLHHLNDILNIAFLWYNNEVTKKLSIMIRMFILQLCSVVTTLKIIKSTYLIKYLIV